jgi:hypothetical protein
MNEFPRKNKTDAGTVFGVLAMVFVGVPILFCLACGFGTWAFMGFPGTSGWGLGKQAAWQHVLDEKRRLHGELVTEINNMAASGQVNFSDLQRLQSRADEIDRQVTKLANEALGKYGNPPLDMQPDLKSTVEITQAMANLRNARLTTNSSGIPSPPGQSMSEMLAKQRADAEQRAQQMQAEAQQREAERRARDQAFADQARARAEEFRNRIASSSPPPSVPFNPSPPFSPPSQPQVEAPPGFPCTNLNQIKPKDLVFARSLDKWYPALVLRKVGTNVTIRYTTNDLVEVVLIDRIRLQTEAADKPDDPAKPDTAPPPAVAQADFPRAPNIVPEVQRLPPGFRPVNPPKPVRTKDDEEAENLLVIKPRKDDVPVTTPASGNTPVPGTPTQPAAAPMPVASYRTWTSEAGTTVEAELVAFEFDVVQLKRRDGKILSLQISQLSPADQTYVREKYK